MTQLFVDVHHLRCSTLAAVVKRRDARTDCDDERTLFPMDFDVYDKDCKECEDDVFLPGSNLARAPFVLE